MKNQHPKRQETGDPIDETAKRRPLWYVGWILYTSLAAPSSPRASAAYLSGSISKTLSITLCPTRDHFLYLLFIVLDTFYPTNIITYIS